jgi:hypothetical protein
LSYWRCSPCRCEEGGSNSSTNNAHEGVSCRDKTDDSDVCLEWMKYHLHVLLLVNFLHGPASCLSRQWEFIVHMLTLRTLRACDPRFKCLVVGYPTLPSPQPESSGARPSVVLLRAALYYSGEVHWTVKNFSPRHGYFRQGMVCRRKCKDN